MRRRRTALYNPYSDRDFVYDSEGQENMYGPYVLPQDTSYTYEPDKEDLRTITRSWPKPRRFYEGPNNGMHEQEPEERAVTTEKHLNYKPLHAQSYSLVLQLLAEARACFAEIQRRRG